MPKLEITHPAPQMIAPVTNPQSSARNGRRASSTSGSAGGPSN